MGSRTTLITGASGGIGAALAEVFAQNQHDCVLVARSQDKLEHLSHGLKIRHGVNTYVLVKDLVKPETPQEIFDELSGKGINIDILVNNAGFGTHGYFWEIPLQDELDELQVNIVALTRLTKLFVPGMIERGYGKVLNVSSMAAFQPGPLMAVYGASKAYVQSFSEAIANELNRTDVTVTALCPGFTKTSFQERAGMEHTRLTGARGMDAETVAKIGYEGLMHGQAVVIPGISNRLMAWLSRVSPRNLVVRGARWMQENTGGE